jgi:hypothetical protein
VKIGDVKTKAIIIYAIAWMAELVNVDRNLTEPQILELSSDILRDYGYIKVEELKYILKRGVKSKIYARLDYNVVMNWFKDYDNERTEIAMDISDQESSQQENDITVAPDSITWGQYLERLQRLSQQGDATATARLDEINNPPQQKLTLITNEQRHQRDVAFKTWYYREYLRRKNGTDQE